MKHDFEYVMKQHGFSQEPYSYKKQVNSTSFIEVYYNDEKINVYYDNGINNINISEIDTLSKLDIFLLIF